MFFSQWKISAKLHVPVKSLSFSDCCSTEVCVQRLKMWLSLRKMMLRKLNLLLNASGSFEKGSYVIPSTQNSVCLWEECYGVDGKAIKTACGGIQAQEKFSCLGNS